MKLKIFLILAFGLWGAEPVILSQVIGGQEPGENGWSRTKQILDCAPRLVDRKDLVDDDFDHRYITNNPRDIEVGYFSVEPITYFEEGRRFCEANLPAAGVSETFFRGTYETAYTLPGDGYYRLRIESNALLFNNEIRVINAQNTIAEIEAVHRLEIDSDTTLNPPGETGGRSLANQAYTWEVEVDESGFWSGELKQCGIELQDREIPAGFSFIQGTREVRGPGVVIIRESVIFRINALSAYKYDPIFQAACLFSLEPLSISAKLLPCAD